MMMHGQFIPLYRRLAPPYSQLMYIRIVDIIGAWHICDTLYGYLFPLKDKTQDHENIYS